MGINVKSGIGARSVTAAALLASTALWMGAAPALAQGQPAAPLSELETRRSFAIPASSLNDALRSFQAQSGMQLSIDVNALRGVSSPGAIGEMTAREALAQLFSGSGLECEVVGGAVTVAPKPGTARSAAGTSVRAVEVQGRSLPVRTDPYANPQAPYMAERLSSSKFSEPLLNTPRTATVLTQEVLEDKDATTLKEIARSTAGVTLGSGEGGNAFGDRFFIRGFDARNDVFVDGVRDPGVSIRENFDDEQVEILRGPASSFAGRGTTGGALNIVTKQAQERNFVTLEGEGGLDDERRRGTLDVNRTVNSVVDVRVNGMVQYSDIAGRDFATDNRWGVAGDVVYHPTSALRLTANYSHTFLWGLPDFGVPTNQVTREPVTESGVRRDIYYGATNRDFTRSSQDVGTLDAEWQVNDSLTLENKLRASHSMLNYIGTIPENPSATSPATAPYASSLTHYSGYVQLNAQSRYEPVNVVNDQPQATFKFDTGPIHHTAVAGGEFSSERLSIQGYSGLTSELTTGAVAFASSGAPIVPVDMPVNTAVGSSVIQLAGNPLRYKVDTKAGYLIDTANYDDTLIVNGGIRYDDYGITASNNTSSRTSSSGIASWNLGVVFKPVKIGSIYFAYATAADPVGDELDATSSSYGGLAATQNATQIFGPQKSQSYEIGTKWELVDRRLLVSAAAFQTDVTNARETAPAGLAGYTSGQIVAGAAYRVQGLDFEAAGKLTDRWSIMGGLVIMAPKITRSIVPTNVGLQLANIAPTSFNLLSKYQVTPWLELGGQSVYASQIKGGSLLAANGGIAYPGAPNPTILPDHWRFDVFAEAKINAHASLKLYVQNLTDKTYYDALYQSAQPFVQVAPGRSVYLDAVLKF